MNMHISANVGLQAHILFRLNFSPEFVTFWGVTREEFGQRPRMKNCDMEGGEVKNIDFLSEILFE